MSKVLYNFSVQRSCVASLNHHFRFGQHSNEFCMHDSHKKCPLLARHRDREASLIVFLLFETLKDSKT